MLNVQSSVVVSVVQVYDWFGIIYVFYLYCPGIIVNMLSLLDIGILFTCYIFCKANEIILDQTSDIDS
jgi:hypothetical protein